jgi:hypothetical protein
METIIVHQTSAQLVAFVGVSSILNQLKFTFLAIGQHNCRDG